VSSVQINSDDFSSVGFALQDAKGLDDGVTQSLPVATLPGAGIPVFGTANYAFAQRQSTITWLYKRAPTIAAVDTALKYVREALSARQLIITHTRRPNQQLIAICTSLPADPLDLAQYVAPYSVSIAATFLSANPFWADVSPQSIAFTTATATPTGTGTAWATVTITNGGASPITNPHIKQRNSAAAIVVDLPTTCVIPVGDAIEIDGVLQRARRRTSGVWAVDMSIVPSGFRYPRVSNLDGVYGTSSWPTIETDLGTGNIVYSRLWA
jgi:hypothetical protein